MYVWITFRGHIKLQKDFKWTVWRSKHWYHDTCWWKQNYFNNFFGCLDFAIFSIYSRLKFLVKVFDVCLKHIYRTHEATKKTSDGQYWGQTLIHCFMIHADENKIILMIFLLFGLSAVWKFSVKVFDVSLIYDMLFSLKKYYCSAPDILQTHLFPCFILQHCISVIYVYCIVCYWVEF